MKEWRTAKELAAERLPHFPQTEQATKRYAEREGWNTHPSWCRDRQGRGGGLEYHINLLPTLARLDYERRHRKITAPQPVAAPEPTLGTNLTARAARERDARLAIVAAFEAFRQGQRLPFAACEEIYVNGYNLGRQPVEGWIKELIPHLSKRSLARWRATKAKGDLAKLAHDPALNRKGKSVLELANGGAVRAFILALIAHQPHLTGAQVRTQCRHEFGDQLSVGAKTIPMPPVRTFQHALKALKSTEIVALTKLSNPDRFRSTMQPSGVGTLRWITEPNALWQIDASPVDALCTDGRHAIYAAIDIATRRLILYVSRTPRASAVALLIRKAVLAWGVPKTIKTDNGSDFVARDTKRLFASLDIEMDLSDAYSPQQKGHVERAIETFQHDCATLLPGYVGHNVADRKQIEDRKSFADRLGQDTADAFGVTLDGPALQTVADRWADTIYAHRAHAGLKGKSPFQAAAEASNVLRTVDERALDILLMPVAGTDGIRSVTKFGVRIDNYHYVVNACLPGERVLVRMDPNDLGKAYAFDAESGLYRGQAVCPELAGLHPATVMQAKREMQSEILAEKTAEARRIIKEITQGPSLIERALTVAARDIPNVVALPKRETPHETPAISAALDVTRELGTTPMSPAAAQIYAEAKAAPIEAPAPVNVTPIRKQLTKHQLFARAMDLEKRQAAGEAIGEENAQWLGGWQQSSDYKWLRKTYGEATVDRSS